MKTKDKANNEKALKYLEAIILDIEGVINKKEHALGVKMSMAQTNLLFEGLREIKKLISTTENHIADINNMVEPYCFYENEPHGKFIALESDMSGRELFFQKGRDRFGSPFFDKGITVSADWFADVGYLYWIPLPDSFKI